MTETKTFRAEVLADSTFRTNRVTTLLLTYPRIIHAQVMTYRAACRNSESTRAREPKRFIEEIRRDPFVPQLWPKEKRGMQPEGYYEDASEERAWRAECEFACDSALRRIERGVHHEIAMRPLEPYMWHRLLITATSWDNVLHQRLDHHAQLQFQVLAGKIRDALAASVPRQLAPNEWHIPFDTDPREPLRRRLLGSVGRSARLSYASHDGTHSFEADKGLGLRCIRNGHLTPAEHQCTPCPVKVCPLDGFENLRSLYPFERDALGANAEQRAKQEQWIQDFFGAEAA